MNKRALFLLVSVVSVYAMEDKKERDESVSPPSKISTSVPGISRKPQSPDILSLQKCSPFNGCIDEGLAIKEFLTLQEFHRRGLR